MSKTKIPSRIINQLLVKSGGRCQYKDCNKYLFQDLVTKKNFNQAYLAHIVADEPGGPRGDIVRSKLLSSKLANLMLLCDTHHRLIDKIEVNEHPEPLLLEMKKLHENRIERVTAIASSNQSHIVTYRANVGIHTRELSYETVSQYLSPEFNPAASDTIDLSLSNSLERDRDDSFWKTEIVNLERQFLKKLQQAFAKGELKHLSVFAFAPIPLLFKLGTLINDVYLATVFQPVRNPYTWKLHDGPCTTIFNVVYPPTKQKQVAVNISLSATINNDRIYQVLGNDLAIYTLTINQPFNDFLKSKKELEEFGRVVKVMLNEIKAVYGQTIPLNIFPAMPVAMAIEFGRVWMPKADMPLFLYDQNTATGGFRKVLEIVNS